MKHVHLIPAVQGSACGRKKDSHTARRRNISNTGIHHRNKFTVNDQIVIKDKKQIPLSTEFKRRACCRLEAR